MSAVLNGEIVKVAAGGPYAYVTYKDGVPQNFVGGSATIASAFNGMRDALAALVPAGETIERTTVQVVSR